MKKYIHRFFGSLQHKAIMALSLVIATMIFSCNKPETQAQSQSAKHQKTLKYASSITMINGVYKIDTNIILANRNKKELVTALVMENLIEKNTTAEIPDFIKAFLTG